MGSAYGGLAEYGKFRVGGWSVTQNEGEVMMLVFCHIVDVIITRKQTRRNSVFCFRVHLIIKK